MNPKISIIIPTYNRAHLIAETLFSVKKQTFLNWECIIVDDHSFDNTEEVVKPFLQDKRFILVKRPENLYKGANSCRNYGFEISHGEFIHWFDSDDIIHPECYKTCIEELDKSTLDFIRFERNVFFGEFNYKLIENSKFNYNTYSIGINDIDAIVTNKIPFNTCNIIWKKTSVGNERFNQNICRADEWEFYQRLISNNLNGISITICFVYARKHIDSKTYIYYKNDLVFIKSKKEAIKLVTQNLMNKQLITPSLLKYLVGYAISFRDKILLNDILKISKTSLKNKLYLKLKFILFPLWKIYKKLSN